jgi:hypothetical protein
MYKTKELQISIPSGLKKVEMWQAVLPKLLESVFEFYERGRMRRGRIEILMGLYRGKEVVVKSLAVGELMARIGELEEELIVKNRLLGIEEGGGDYGESEVDGDK